MLGFCSLKIPTTLQCWVFFREGLAVHCIFHRSCCLVCDVLKVLARIDHGRFGYFPADACGRFFCFHPIKPIIRTMEPVSCVRFTNTVSSFDGGFYRDVMESRRAFRNALKRASICANVTDLMTNTPNSSISFLGCMLIRVCVSRALFVMRLEQHCTCLQIMLNLTA